MKGEAMSVRKRKWVDKQGRTQEKWMIHIKHTHPDGSRQIIRKISPVQTRRGAEQYERELRQSLLDGSLTKKEESETTVEAEQAPMTVSEFVDVFLDEYSRTEGLRPRYIRGQRTAFDLHVLPVIGAEQIDTIGSKHFGLVKRAMLKKNPDYSPKTVNNVLAVLSRMVRFWWERQGLDSPHINAGLLKLDEVEAKVYEGEVYERLVEGARRVGPEVLAIVLLMGDGGLRQGELRGLHVTDVRFDPPIIRVQRALCLDNEDEHSPKGRRNRTVPMTARLVEAMREQLRMRPRGKQPQVFLRDGAPLTSSCVRARVRSAEREAGLDGDGRSHVLRHTFVTELAESDVPARVIQDLAGHKDLKTTLRYMHVRDGQAQSAIQGLERRQAQRTRQHIHST
ncbi:tyrosine-type recombinase/integrase [Nannocystaceae bacterium ST9]